MEFVERMDFITMILLFTDICRIEVRIAVNYDKPWTHLIFYCCSMSQYMYKDLNWILDFINGGVCGVGCL